MFIRLYVSTYQARVGKFEVPNWHLKLSKVAICDLRVLIVNRLIIGNGISKNKIISGIFKLKNINYQRM